MAVQTNILKSLPYYFGLTSNELESIKGFFFERAVDKGEMFLLDGENSEALHFVISGVVKLFKESPTGKEQILKIVRSGESLNDVPIYDGYPNNISAQAMTPVLLYGIKKDDLQIIMKRYPQVAFNIIKVLAGQMRHLIMLIEDLSFKSVLGRVASILLHAGGDGTGPHPRLTQQDMAAMAGTAREMVGRSLKVLEQDSIIRMDRNRIVIANRQALKEIAGVDS